MFEEIKYERRGPAGVITLYRPQANNAYTARMGRELTDAINLCSDDDDVRVIVLTAEGRHFCVGADISAGASSFDTSEGGAGAKNFGSVDGQRRDGAGFIGAMFNSRKPIIVAFNGSAVGVGLTLTLPADFRIASSDAKFGFVFARRGLPPEAGSVWFLPQLVGLRQALAWCLTGRVFPAQEALEGGLLNEVVAPDQLMARALELAHEIADNTAPVSVALTRQLLWRFGADTQPFEALRHDGRFAMELGKSDDVKEGVSAFLEKRPPAFPGKVSTDMPKGFPWWKD